MNNSDLLAHCKASPDRAAFLATLSAYELRRIVRALRLNESNGKRFYRMDENRERIQDALKEQPL